MKPLVIAIIWFICAATLLAVALGKMIEMLATPTNAQEARPLAILAEKAGRQLIMPPLEYSKPYTGRVFITRVMDKEQVMRLCNLIKPTLACSFARPQKNECQIVLTPDEMMLAEGYLPVLVMRHEQGHCLGWSVKHENPRVPTQAEIKDAIAKLN